MFAKINAYCRNLEGQFDLIAKERKMLLEKIAQHITSKQKQQLPANLIYICTHNSRRSHFGQIWSQVAASYYQIGGLNSYSGGTEATAFNKNAIGALKRIGFIVEEQQAQTINPVFYVHYDEIEKPAICFSKVYNDHHNPQSQFAAIMTCSDAEENCPFIPGVELRISTTYDDPKEFDNTPLQDAKYDERCKQIALETLYVLSKVK